MADATITCPTCSAKIPLTESLAAPLLAATRQDYEARLAAQQAEIAARAEGLEGERAALAAARADLDGEIAARVAALRQDVAREAAEAKAAEIAELAAALAERDGKLAAAQAAQAEAMRKSRELDAARAEVDLTVETRVGDMLGQERAKARAEAETALGLKVAERETQIAAMQRQIEELKRRAEQGSQQLQGEVLELALEAALRDRFPADAIEPVAKGDSGADVMQRVRGPGGQLCGAILWESKRTRNWSDGWLGKLRADQRARDADLALLVSEALPRDVASFGWVDGVWVSDRASALPLAVALRQSLIEVQQARAARAGQGEKMERVYDYLTGPRFRHRVEAIVEKFTDMSADLDRERKAMTRLWAKREMQIQGVLEATVGLYGDLQGIAGQSLGEIEGLEIPLLDGPEDA